MASVLSWEEGDGVEVVASAVEGVLGDGQPLKFKFAVRRTVIHFSICIAWEVSLRLTNVGAANLEGQM
jgi:hypothetical protein